MIEAFLVVDPAVDSSSQQLAHFIFAHKNFSDKIMVMYKGKIVEEGLVQNVLQSPSHPYTQELLQAAFYTNLRNNL